MNMAVDVVHMDHGIEVLVISADPEAVTHSLSRDINVDVSIQICFVLLAAGSTWALIRCQMTDGIHATSFDCSKGARYTESSSFCDMALHIISADKINDRQCRLRMKTNKKAHAPLAPLDRPNLSA